MALEDNGDLVKIEDEIKQPAHATVYTEVSPERAQEILQGSYESSTPPKHPPNRWYAEIVLDHFIPPHLKDAGVGRKQTIFTSPIPYQGGNPIQGKELLALGVSTKDLYVAESDHITEIITPNISIGSLKRIALLKKLSFAEDKITREEFENKLNELAEQERTELVGMSEEQAKNYWKSVIPYTTYIKEERAYHEPEVLMTPETEIFSAQKA